MFKIFPNVNSEYRATDRSGIPVQTWPRAGFGWRLWSLDQRPRTKLPALGQGKRDIAKGRPPWRESYPEITRRLSLQGEAPKNQTKSKFDSESFLLHNFWDFYKRSKAFWIICASKVSEINAGFLNGLCFPGIKKHHFIAGIKWNEPLRIVKLC